MGAGAIVTKFGSPDAMYLMFVATHLVKTFLAIIITFLEESVEKRTLTVKLDQILLSDYK